MTGNAMRKPNGTITAGSMQTEPPVVKRSADDWQIAEGKRISNSLVIMKMSAKIEDMALQATTVSMAMETHPAADYLLMADEQINAGAVKFDSAEDLNNAANRVRSFLGLDAHLRQPR
jgi:hypothetical protein